jgi:hypothetical protein
VNTASGLCLDDVWGGGQVLAMVTCMNTPEQQWTITGSFPTSFQITDDAFHHCVDVRGNNQTNGQTVDPATCNRTSAQNWTSPECGVHGASACSWGTPCQRGLRASGPDHICCTFAEVDYQKKCVACGGAGQHACDNNACNSGLSASGNPAICCASGQIDSGGSCVACGAQGQPACAGGSCNAHLIDVNGKCVACGANGEACCSNNACNSPLACIGTAGGGTKCGVPCANEGQLPNHNNLGACCGGLVVNQNTGKCAPQDAANCGNTTYGGAPPCCLTKNPMCTGAGVCSTDTTTKTPYYYCCDPQVGSCQPFIKPSWW